jgi:gamma-glutamyltranspeptidase/glutathione hydrolase
VVDAAARTLAAGGCAVDAALAGGFAAAMAEPALTSLGGGGFLHHWSAPDEPPDVLDFFVDTPGLSSAPSARAPHVDTVIVRFGDTAEQVFHAGWGTVAVPGCFTGYLEAHRRWGRLPLAQIVAPARDLARDGVDLDPVQLQFLEVVADLLAVTPASAAVYAQAQATGRFANPAYAAVLEGIGTGRVRGVDDGAFGDALIEAMAAGGGRVTRADLAGYRALLRAPIMARRGDARVWTNPPPSFGGAIVLDALGSLRPQAPIAWPAVVTALNAATRRERERDLPQATRGTTHISVVDAGGRMAAMTTSNGSGSGTIVSGVQLNNMLGEEDLNAAVRRHGPMAVADLAPGLRMGSMMAPTMVRRADGARLALGTGGSERIRSTLLGVLLRVLDVGSDLADAVAAPRVHATEALVDVEPGLADVESLMGGGPPVRVWPAPDLYFGGVHGVVLNPDGGVEAVADPRRGGAVAIVD